MTDIERRIAESFARQELMRHLGAELSHVGPGRVHIVLPYRTELTQQDGDIHAGATSAIADSASGQTVICVPDRAPERRQ